MKFGSVNINKARGGILAHSLTLPSGKRLRKGIILNDDILEVLQNEAVSDIIIAMPEKGDVSENQAAAMLSEKFKTSNIRVEEATTGRVNMFADSDGLFQVSKPIIDALNAIDPAITIATLKDAVPVNQGRLVATIKIIPYAVSSSSLEEALSLDLHKAIKISPFKAKRVGLIATQLPTLKPSAMDKTAKTLARRLALYGSKLAEEVRVAHDARAVMNAIEQLKNNTDLLIVFGASAISDISDCIPEGINQAGGRIIRFGMPVDPGNLMLLAKLDEVTIIGAPGCARSIAENGFDWILHKVMADVEVTSQEIGGLGVGGLLMETGARPHPREKSTDIENKIAGLILAAGQSRRMGEDNKMTIDVDEKPMVRHVAEALSMSSINQAFMVTGHEAEKVYAVVEDLDISQIENPDYELGLSSSLAAGIKAIEARFTHILVMLGDMPFVTSQMIDRMAASSNENPNAIVVASHKGKRGNPVLWPRAYFAELQSITGDVGAKHILAANQDSVVEVELGEAASIDLDTKAALKIYSS